MVDDATRKQLEQAAAHIKAGRKEDALDILVPLLHRQPDLVAGWWLAANALDQEVKVRQILKRILKLRPGEPRARKKLAEMDSRAAQSRRPATGSLNAAPPLSLESAAQPEAPAPSKEGTGLLRRVDPSAPIADEDWLKMDEITAAALDVQPIAPPAPRKAPSPPPAPVQPAAPPTPGFAMDDLRDLYPPVEDLAPALFTASDVPFERKSGTVSDARKVDERPAEPTISERFITVGEKSSARQSRRRLRLDWKFVLAIVFIFISLASTAILVGLALRA